jgi:CHAD domain-containing protein
MKKKQLERVAGAYSRELVVSAENLLPGFSMDAVHRYRVQYKKLRAFLRMIRTGAKDTGHVRIPTQLKTVYRMSGSIRDLQLHQQRLQYVYRSRPKKPETYLLQVKQATAGCKKELRNFFSENNKATGIEKNMQALPDSFSKKALHQYIQQQWDIVEQLMDSRHFTDAGMHRIRKLLKDLYYNMDALDKKSIVLKIGKRKRELALKLFDTLLDELGKFQDLTTEIRLLAAVQIKSLPAAEQKALEQLRAACVLQKNKLKRSLVAQLKTGFGRA